MEFWSDFAITSTLATTVITIAILIVAMAELKYEKTAKCGIKIKRHKAGWDEKYLKKLLGI